MIEGPGPVCTHHTCVGAAVNLGSIIAAKYAVGASLNQITGPALSQSLPATPHSFLTSLISDVPVEYYVNIFVDKCDT